MWCAEVPYPATVSVDVVAPVAPDVATGKPDKVLATDDVVYTGSSDGTSCTTESSEPTRTGN